VSAYIYLRKTSTSDECTINQELADAAAYRRWTDAARVQSIDAYLLEEHFCQISPPRYVRFETTK